MACAERTLRICEKGHRYYKSSDCPTCPACAAKAAPRDGFLSRLAAPARSALEHDGITTLEKLSTYSAKEILGIHGIGPRSMPPLREALDDAGLAFRRD